MPDISLCDNDKCAIKNTCYRYMAKPSPYLQTYSTFYPEKKMDGGEWECEWLIYLPENRPNYDR